MCGRAKRAAGGVPASEASFPPEASQVVAEGDGLRVLHNYDDYAPRHHTVFLWLLENEDLLVNLRSQTEEEESKWMR